MTLALSNATAASHNCSKGKYWVRSYDRKAYTRSDGTFVSATFVKGHCKSQSKANDFLDSRFKDDIPKDWPHKTEKFKAWTTEETERLIEALEALPEGLWSQSIQGIYRAKASKDHPNPASSMDKTIVLYDEAFTKQRDISRVFGHEMAHQIYIDLSKADRKDYWFSTNWLPIDPEESKFFSRMDSYVQDDGRESPEEDFANNVEFYLFAPQKLKKTTPHAYRWIKEHFGDKFKLKKGKTP